MNHLRVSHMTNAFHGLNQFFTHHTTWDDKAVSHNQYNNDHFLNAYNILIESEFHHNSITLEELGYSKVKATHLIRSYIDFEKMTDWISLIETNYEKNGAIDSDIVMRTSENSKHTNGPCIMGFSFRWRENGRPVLTVMSRSVELPQIFGGDTILIAAIAHLIKERLGSKEEIKVNWYIASARVKSRAANFYRLMIHPLPVEYLNKDFQAHIDKQWNKILADQEKKVTFSKLVRLQKEYKRVVIDQEEPPERTGMKQFLDKLEGGIK